MWPLCPVEYEAAVSPSCSQMLCSDTLTHSGVGVNSSCGGATVGDTCMVFCAEGYQAVSYDTSILTCAYNSSDNTVDWEGKVPLCLVVTCDVIASSRKDFSECFSLTYNETCVVRCSVGYTGVGDKNIPEFMGDSDGHLKGSLECAEKSLELSTVRTLAERVLPCDEHFVQRNCNEFLQWDGVAEDDDVDDDSLAFAWDPSRAFSTESEAGALRSFNLLLPHEKLLPCIADSPSFCDVNELLITRTQHHSPEDQKRHGLAGASRVVAVEVPVLHPGMTCNTLVERAFVVSRLWSTMH